MADPVDMIVPQLREMRAENAALHKKTRLGLRAFESRLEKIEQAPAGYRHALSADSFLSKLVIGEFEERIELPERKVRELECHK